MSTMIRIRNVPDEIHRAAKSRAAREGLTLSEFALQALRRAVETPTLHELAARIDALPPVELSRPAAEWIRQERDRP